MPLQGMNTTVNIQHATVAVDGVGDTNRTFNTILHNLVARIDDWPVSRDSQLVEREGRQNVSDYWAILEGDYKGTINEEDRVVDNYDNRTYRVIRVDRLGLATNPVHHTELRLMSTDDDRFEP